METYIWKKTANGHKTGDPKSGANIRVITRKYASDADLDRAVNLNYAKESELFKRGWNCDV